MRVQSPLPPAGSGEFFLTEGGTETEMMYRHGFELPEFAIFPLLEDQKAVTAFRHALRRQIGVAANTIETLANPDLFSKSCTQTNTDCESQ